ncbi:MAG: MarR family winged helix-turn-helix transcriptional regulator [Ruegeria sp.]
MAEDDPDNTDKLSPEIHAMMGVYALYWKLQESIDLIATDLSHQECHMLIKLEVPKRMGVLASDMLSVPSTITATADSLESGGYLTRQNDPDDRRALLLVLTDKGEEARKMIQAEAGELFRRASGLNCEETEQFARLARKIRKTILETGIPEGLNK